MFYPQTFITSKCLNTKWKPYSRNNKSTYLQQGYLSAVKLLAYTVATHRVPTLHIELVRNPEVTLQSWVADHTRECLALDMACGLPQVAHLRAGGAVDFVKQLHFWLAKKIGLPGHLSRGPGSLSNTGGHHSFIATINQGSWTCRHVDLWLHCGLKSEQT